MGLEEKFKGNLETIWMVADMFPEGFGTEFKGNLEAISWPKCFQSGKGV